MEAHKLDVLVRHLLDGGWPAAQALGITAPIRVVAGIGTLDLGPEGHTWQPVVPTAVGPGRAAAPEPLQAARKAICATCPRLTAGRCSVAGCGCGGLGDPTARFGRCPLDRWPAETPALEGR